MLHLLLLTYPGEFKGNVKKWQRESKKNFDSFLKLANRDRLIDFFNHNCSHLALPKKLLKSMPEEAVSVEDLTLWFEEDDEDSLEIIKEYGLEVWQAKELQVLAQQRSIHDLLRELTPDPGQPADQFTRFLHPLIEEGYEEIDDLDDLVVDDEYDKLMSYNRKYKSNPQKRSAMMWSELRGMNMTYSEAHRISEMATEWASRYMFRLLLDSHKNASELHEYEYTPSGVYRHLIPWQEDDPHNTLTYRDRATPFADPRTQRRIINAMIAEEIEDIEDLVYWRPDEPIEGPRPGEFVTKYELLSLQADPRVGMFRERDDLAELYHQRDVLERYTQRAS